MRNYGHFRAPARRPQLRTTRDARYAGLTEVFMKLRRALAVAATTAALAPLALLSAPAALATEGDAVTPGTSVSETPETSGTPTPGTQEPTEKPGEPGDSGAEPDEPGDKPGEPGGKPGDAQKPGEKPGDKPGDKPGGKPGEDPGGKPGDDATKPGGEEGDKPPSWGKDHEKDPTPEPCEVDDETGDDLESRLELSLQGLPRKIAAGSGWHEFTLTAANSSDDELGEVNWLAAVDNFSNSEHERNWLSTYARIQYLDPAAGGWKSIIDEVSDGSYFGKTTLGAHEQIELKLRLDISAKAPAGPGYALGLGGYTDAELECTHSSFDFFEFTVLKPGSDIDYPGEAIELPDRPAPRPAPKPQGGAKPIKHTTVTTAPTPSGSLAATGSSSALPTIGIVGGVAVVAGAGAVFVVRRRGNSDAA